MTRVETILVFALAIPLAGCVTGGKPPVVQAAAPPTPQPLSVPQTQAQLPPEQPLNPDALATPQTPAQEPPRRPAQTAWREPTVATPAPPPAAPPTRAPIQDIVPAIEQKRLQEEADSRKREARRLLEQAKTHGLNSREKSAAQRIESFVQQSDAPRSATTCAKPTRWRTRLSFWRGSCRVPSSEFDERRRTVGAGLAERKLDCMLVAYGPNLRYLSGFTGSNGNLLVLPGQSILFTDPRYQIQAGQEVTCKVRIVTGPLIEAVAGAIAKLGVRRIGFEPALTTCDLHESLQKKLPMKAALAPVSGWIEGLRMVKSPAEIARIRRSVETNSRAFEQAVARVKVGMKEQDLAAELEYRMRRLGAEKPSFETIVASGPRSAWPHAQPSAAPLRSGQLVVVDMGAVQEGYCSDMTRMLFLGSPNAKVKRTYRAVLEAQMAAIDAVRPGVTTARVDGAARLVLKGYGLDRAFVHSTGHGLGLEIHEPPRIGKRDKTKLAAGMAITIEPEFIWKDLAESASRTRWW